VIMRKIARKAFVPEAAVRFAEKILAYGIAVKK